jgi:hypothetical protein
MFNCPFKRDNGFSDFPRKLKQLRRIQMNRKTLFTSFAVVLILMSIATGTAAKSSDSNVARPSLAAGGTAFTYQGQLRSNSTPVTGSCDFQFSLFDAATGGVQIGAPQTISTVAVSNGLFTVNLDFGTGVFEGAARWLSIDVRCPAGSGSYTLLSPRQALTAVPYALSLVPGTIISGPVKSPAIEVINTTSTGWSSAIYGEIHSSTDDSMAIYGYSKATGGWSNGVVGGSDSSGGNGVFGYVTADSGSPNGVYGSSNAPDGNGMLGVNDTTIGYGTGVLGVSNSADGSGVAGRNNSTTGDAKGVYGETSSPNGAGVYGVVITTTAGNNGRGVYGLNNATSGVGDGVFGETYSPNGAGVSGFNNSTTGGQGVWGGTNSTDGAGVSGVNLATTGLAYGVKGENYSNEGAGVVGRAYGIAGWTIGVYGESDSPDGNGLAGVSSVGGNGVFAQSITGTALYAKSGSGTIIAGVDQSDSWKFSVSAAGDVYADGAYHCGQSGGGEPGTCVIQNSPADFAEMLPASANLQAGDVLIIGRDGKLARSTQPYQTTVVGVYSTRPGYLGGGQHWGKDDYAPLAIAGVIQVKASAENGAIYPGDSLTTSSTPGYAMKAAPLTLNGITFYPSGVVIGKALERLETGTGLIQMVVTLQ